MALTDHVEYTIVDLISMVRLGEVEDIATCPLYLASLKGSNLIGGIIQVNAGLNSLNIKTSHYFG